jgi:hypothetical protein
MSVHDTIAGTASLAGVDELNPALSHFGFSIRYQ